MDFACAVWDLTTLYQVEAYNCLTTLKWERQRNEPCKGSTRFANPNVGNCIKETKNKPANWYLIDHRGINIKLVLKRHTNLIMKLT